MEVVKDGNICADSVCSTEERAGQGNRKASHELCTYWINKWINFKVRVTFELGLEVQVGVLQLKKRMPPQAGENLSRRMQLMYKAVPPKLDAHVLGNPLLQVKAHSEPQKKYGACSPI